MDAERLVRLLRGDLLPTVWIPPTAVREARELIRHRVSLVWERTGVTNRLLALLTRRNLQPTSGARWSTVSGRRELEALPLPPIPTTVRADCLALRRLLDEQIRRLDQELVTRWGDDVRVRRLTTIPGIGPFLAILVVLELADISRFPSAKHMASYIGLTPRVRASAGRVRVGHISKEGNRLLRWALVVAATQAARRPGPLRAWYRLVARRIAEICYRVWKEETDCFAVLRHGGVRG